jgi:hypothetical protein
MPHTCNALNAPLAACKAPAIAAAAAALLLLLLLLSLLPHCTRMLLLLLLRFCSCKQVYTHKGFIILCWLVGLSLLRHLPVRQSTPQLEEGSSRAAKAPVAAAPMT